jgi:hypothetical protein
MSTTKPKEPLAIECRFAMYSKSNTGNETDIHFIKEQIHNLNEDGTSTVTPNTRIIYNYKRDFWVANKGAQDHQDKKEWIDLNDAQAFKSTQTHLLRSAAAALGKPWFKGSLRDLQESPYLYGTDITSTAIIKQSYKNKWNVTTPYTNAVFDTETDVLHGTGQIMMATVSMKKTVITAVQEKFVRGHADAINKIHKLAEKYIGDVIEKRGIKLEIVVVADEISVVKTTINKAHELKPDFLSVWSLSFDIGKVIDACARVNITPASVLSDPSVPNEYKYFKYKEGPAKRITASGVVMSFKPAARWHSVFCPASFHWIDAMSAYKYVRSGNAEEPSYSLDAILTKELNITKLKFKEADKYKGLAWHEFMQSNYPLEYIVYNIFDCVSMEMLDEKTLDLQLQLPMFSGCSDFTDFKSQPKRAADAFHHFCLANGKVMGTTSGDMVEEFDSETISGKGHIVMLDASLVADNGLCIIEENPNLRTNIRVAVADLDIVGAYPANGICLNVSKETTKRELIKISGVDETTKRMASLNMSSGFTNAVDICCTLYNLPTFDKMLQAFEQEVTI